MYKVNLPADYGCLFDRPYQSVKVIPFDEFLTHLEAGLRFQRDEIATHFEKAYPTTFLTNGKDLAIEVRNINVRNIDVTRFLEKYQH